MSRVLCIDFGEKRIGLALSDPNRVIASPFGTVTRRPGKRPPWTELERIIRENEVGELVVGLPLALSGEETEWTGEVRQFGDALQRRADLPLSYYDERMSSVSAERAVRTSGLRKSQREEKERVDAAAAAIILRNFLHSRASTPE